MENIQLIILAGGKGKRMNSELPKVLVPFHGKPMVEYIIDACGHSGITTKPILVVGHGREMVMDHFGDRANYAIQEQQLGTGDAVKISENKIPENIEHVLVLYGDQPNVKGSMIANLVRTHLDQNKNLTMATVTVPDFEDWYKSFRHWGRIVRDTNGQIIGNVEFKDATEHEKLIKEVNPAYFCFKKDWLFENLKNLKNENSQGEYYLTDLIAIGANDGGIASVFISPEEALGANTVDELKEMERIIKKTD